MTVPETEFRDELDVFRKEVEEAIQCFYIFQTVHNIARGNTQVYGGVRRVTGRRSPTRAVDSILYKLSSPDVDWSTTVQEIGGVAGRG